MNNETSLYREILMRIKYQGYLIHNERTKTKVRQYISAPYIFTSWIYKNFPLLQNRQYYPYIAAAETAWQLLGTRDATFINKWAPKIWSKFTDEYGMVSNAQGSRWRHFFGRDQIACAIERIRNDPTNRQIILSSWDPGIDGLGNIQPNTHCLPFMNLRPCTTTQHLHMTVFSRSADMVLGFPYDVYNFAFLLYMFAATTGFKPGMLSIVLNNYHVYMLEDHVDILNRVCFEKSIESDASIDTYPKATLCDIIENPDAYVQWVKDNMFYEHAHKASAELVK